MEESFSEKLGVSLMNTEIEKACRVVSEKIMGWGWESEEGYYIPGSDPELRWGRGRQYLLTGDGMVELMRTLSTMGYISEIDNCGDAEIRCLTVQNRGKVKIFDSESPQAALVLAAAKLPECQHD